MTKGEKVVACFLCVFFVVQAHASIIVKETLRVENDEVLAG
jgi:hypothetical protein